MKSFIGAITITIVLTLLPTGSITPLTALTVATEREGGVVDVVESAPASRTNDAIIQLRTLLSTTNQQSGGGKVLVIPTAEIKPQDIPGSRNVPFWQCEIIEPFFTGQSIYGGYVRSGLWSTLHENS